MALVSRRPRPRLGSLAPIALLAAACSLVKPLETPLDKQAAAEELARSGRHEDAARRYAELAVQIPAESDNYDLLSAEQWIAAHDIAQAKRAFAAVSAQARTAAPASRALVAAEIAVAENDGAGAARELDSITMPSAPALAQNYWYLRGVSAFLIGHPLDGTRGFVERERYLTDPAALRANRDELFARIRSSAERGESLHVPPATEPVVAGWLQLGPIAVDLQRNPMLAAAALENWRRLNPQHPANDTVRALASNQTAVASELTEQIALLLPLSGRAEAAGTAVRDGFIAAYYEQASAMRPRLRIYDVATETAAGAYQHAIQDGAAFVVGPLTKEDVAAVAPLSAGHTPVLALNFLAETANAPHNFYQFALLPEDEARIVARRLAAEGKLKGVSIVPQGEWGSRIGSAFADEFSRLGGTVVDTGRYESGRADFSDTIIRTLQVHGGKGYPATHRGDAAFIFLAGTPGAERLMLSQLKFHYAGDIPVYSTSDGFEPGSGANGDLDGLSFPDMPWMVSADAPTARIRDLVRNTWPTRTARRDRLFAFGFDAYRLVPALRSNTLNGPGAVAGVTGRLRLDDHDRIRRDLDWAQIRNGEAAPL